MSFLINLMHPCREKKGIIINIIFTGVTFFNGIVHMISGI